MRCDTPIIINSKKSGLTIPVPCGKCPPCKKRRVNSWVFRMLKEDERSSSSCFLTLTYNTDTVPISRNGFMTLQPRDLQLFFKRLRKFLGKSNLKYYAVGEYGSRSARPHYHVILFNLPDIVHRGGDVYTSASIDAAWKDGAYHIGMVSGASIAYVTKYIDKPSKIPLHRNDDRIKEFSRMSKGLGDNYLTDATVRYHQNDLERNFITMPGNHRIALPRYYRDRIYDDDMKEQQRSIISTAVAKDIDIVRDDFYKNYPDCTEDDFDDYLTNQRDYRHFKFYKNWRPRENF